MRAFLGGENSTTPEVQNHTPLTDQQPHAIHQFGRLHNNTTTQLLSSSYCVDSTPPLSKMSSSSVESNVSPPLKKKVEEALAMEYFFTDLTETATCLICSQRVLFNDSTMKRHYLAKHAWEYDQYKGRKRKSMSDKLHAEFKRNVGVSAGPDPIKEPQPGI